MHDPKTVDSIRAAIVSVDSLLPMKEVPPGIHLLVKANGEEIPVHLGPRVKPSKS